MKVKRFFLTQITQMSQLIYADCSRDVKIEGTKKISDNLREICVICVK